MVISSGIYVLETWISECESALARMYVKSRVWLSLLLAFLFALTGRPGDDVGVTDLKREEFAYFLIFRYLGPPKFEPLTEKM
jgi:hypothetical protein